MMTDQRSYVSPELKMQANVMPTGEVLWPITSIVQVLKDLAAADLVILGFDIVVRGSLGASVWGQSAYEMDDDLQVKEWGYCVSQSLQLALNDVSRTQQLAGLTPPLDDVWYLVNAVDRAEAERLKHAQNSIEIRTPLKESPLIKRYLDLWRAGRLD